MKKIVVSMMIIMSLVVVSCGHKSVKECGKCDSTVVDSTKTCCDSVVVDSVK